MKERRKTRVKPLGFSAGFSMGEKTLVAVLVLSVVGGGAYLFFSEYGDTVIGGDASKPDAVSLKEPDAASQDGMTPPDDPDMPEKAAASSDDSQPRREPAPESAPESAQESAMAATDGSDTPPWYQDAASPDEARMSRSGGLPPPPWYQESSPPGGLTPDRAMASEVEHETVPEMIGLSAGSFRMGDVQGGGERSELPARTVHVESFSLGKYEVMEFQFEAFVTATGYDAGDDWRRDSKGGDYPVVSVSWDDAQAYIDWLNGRTGKRYRLPSEAEWEYAARAGGATRYHFGDDADRLRRYANYGGRLAGPTGAGSFEPNQWGLYDLHGNAAEWVQDCWHGDYEEAPGDGASWMSSGGGDCEEAVLRGGSWSDPAAELRSANRIRAARAVRRSGYGFRLAHD